MITKRTIGISIFLLLVFCGLILFISKERKANSLINPEIYPAFRKVENHALLYVEQKIVDREEYERCKFLVNRMEEDSRKEYNYPDFRVSAEEYYNFLEGLGFELPPFRLQHPPTEEQKKQAMIEQNRLMELQTKIIKEQINKDLRTIEETIKSQEIE